MSQLGDGLTSQPVRLVGNQRPLPPSPPDLPALPLAGFRFFIVDDGEVEVVPAPVVEEVDGLVIAPLLVPSLEISEVGLVGLWLAPPCGWLV